MRKVEESFVKDWNEKKSSSVKKKADWLASRCNENVKKITEAEDLLNRKETESLAPVLLELEQLKFERNLLLRCWEGVAKAAGAREQKLYCIEKALTTDSLNYTPVSWAVEMVAGEFWDQPEIKKWIDVLRYGGRKFAKTLRKISKNHPSDEVRAYALLQVFIQYGGLMSGYHFHPANPVDYRTVKRCLSKRRAVCKELLKKYPRKTLRDTTVAKSLNVYKREMELLQIGKELPEVIRRSGVGLENLPKELAFEKGEVKLSKDAAILLHFVTPGQVDPFGDLKKLKEKYQQKLQIICVIDGNKSFASNVIKHHKVSWPVFYENFTSVSGGFGRSPKIQLYWGDYPAYNLRKYHSVLLAPGRKLYAIGDMNGDLSQLVQKALEWNK